MIEFNYFALGWSLAFAVVGFGIIVMKSLIILVF